tara:strand:+ start:104 stop:505 length:402 start_codon:yes stop_codon:yes gene_type:complete
MKTVTRLKTETQFIRRKGNERAYTQTLHSILFLSRVLNKGNQSHDILTFKLKDNEHVPFQYTDNVVLFDGTTREEFYTALVQRDCIHIKISFTETHSEESVDKDTFVEDFDWSKLENKEPKVICPIDLAKKTN